ncbi:MAG: hypothetical protein Q8M24_04190 [Pseudolabrys sp.]|nr:hypothetical protein [Pseudolabrys sp.]MDP2294647.1 hypothetical protein [Pseudolabrys sp.]
MSDTNCDAIPAPPCPVCGGPTVLKHRHSNSKVDTDTCVFKCTVCGVVYPIHVPAMTPRQPRTLS